MLEKIEKLLLSKEELDNPASPIHDAVYVALHNYVKKGNKLEDLPWFALSKGTTNKVEYKEVA